MWSEGFHFNPALCLYGIKFLGCSVQRFGSFNPSGIQLALRLCNLDLRLPNHPIGFWLNLTHNMKGFCPSLFLGPTCKTNCLIASLNSWRDCSKALSALPMAWFAWAMMKGFMETCNSFRTFVCVNEGPGDLLDPSLAPVAFEMDSLAHLVNVRLIAKTAKVFHQDFDADLAHFATDLDFYHLGWTLIRNW